MEKTKNNSSRGKFAYSIIDFTLVFVFILILIRMID